MFIVVLVFRLLNRRFKCIHMFLVLFRFRKIFYNFTTIKESNVESSDVFITKNRSSPLRKTAPQLLTKTQFFLMNLLTVKFFLLDVML